VFFNWLKIACCASIVATVQAGELNTETIFSLRLKSLQVPKFMSLSDYQHKYILMSFFAPDCSWCFRQILAFNELSTGCSANLQVILIGTQGTRQELQQELRRSQTSLPAFLSSSALQQLIGPISATPVTLLFDPQGTQRAILKGYTPQSPLFEAICQEHQ